MPHPCARGEQASLGLEKTAVQACWPPCHPRNPATREFCGDIARFEGGGGRSVLDCHEAVPLGLRASAPP
jgi:hypothetical protein